MQMKIKNGQEIHNLLQQLPVQVEKKLLRQALAKGAAVIRDEARLLAPRESGLLAKAIKTSRDTKNGRVIAKVKLKGKHAYLATFHEYGAGAHLIAVTGARQGRKAVKKAKDGTGKIKGGAMKIGDDFAAGIIQHPGVQSRPFLRPAMDNKASEAIDVIGEFIASYLSFGNISAPTISVDEEE